MLSGRERWVFNAFNPFTHPARDVIFGPMKFLWRGSKSANCFPINILALFDPL
jgi:hypothetical protein